MKNKSFVITAFLIAGIILGGLGAVIFFAPKNIINIKPLSENEAIYAIQAKNPELKEYPSNQLPPKSIKTEKAENGWYVGFMQEGSGRPVLAVKCFLIDDKQNITVVGEYVPALGADESGVFSPKTCTFPGSAPDTTAGQKCEVENCHGLDITCGSNPPEMCTAMYALGDKCLQYARCGVSNGQCQQFENPQFTQCKTCAQNCEKDNPNDPMKAFECESKCQ